MKALVDAHFEGGLSVEDEHRMRGHLDRCTKCRAHYRRRQILAELDPAAASPLDRVGRGLGFGKPAPRRRTWIVPTSAALALAASLALFVNIRGDGFTSRGTPEKPAAQLTVARVMDGGLGGVGSSIRRDDELAFAYDNTSGHRYLMVYGVDEQRHVYWFFPAWNDPAADPASIAIEPGPHELREAVRHELAGSTLEIHALFTSAPRKVREVEADLAAAGARPARPEEEDVVVRLGVVR